MGKRRKPTMEEIIEKERKEFMTKCNLTEREFLQQVAYHEAGHAVVGRYFNIRSREAEIEKGSVTHMSLSDGIDIFGWKSVKQIWRGSIIGTYAGFFAESRYAGWDKHPDRKKWFQENGGRWFSMAPYLPSNIALGDHSDICEKAEALGFVDDWGSERYEKAHAREARRLVNRLWPWIDAFAKLLFKRKKLGYRAIETFFERHPMECINLRFKPLKWWATRFGAMADKQGKMDFWNSIIIYSGNPALRAERFEAREGKE